MRRVVAVINSFALGIFYAGLGTAALVAVQLLWAPPSGGPESSEADADRFAIAPQFAGSAPAQTADSDTPVTAQSDIAPPDVHTDSKAQRELALGIQRELKRVGCYSGALDGRWTEKTRAAMASFNAHVKVQLSLVRPDYILLTLLQGQQQKACGGDSTIATGTRHAPQNRAAAVRKHDRSWTTKVTEAPAPQPVPRQEAAPNTQPRQLGERIPTAVVNTLEPAAEPTIRPSDPLPGRMAIGGPAYRPYATSGSEPGQGDPVALHHSDTPAHLADPSAAPQRGKDPHAARNRAAAAAATENQRRSASARSWQSETFSRLRLDSP